MRAKTQDQITQITKQLEITRCVHLSALAKLLQWSYGKTRNIVIGIMEPKRLAFTKRINDNGIFKIYVSLDSSFLPNDPQQVLTDFTSEPDITTQTSIAIVPPYYKKIDELFGVIVSSKDRKFLVQYLSEIGLELSDIMKLQQEANEMENKES